MLPKKRVVFDIETEQFSEEFNKDPNIATKTKLAPKMRLACLYEEHIDEYSYFLSKDAKKLIAKLKSADEVISYNGNSYDYLVLRNHYGLSKNYPKVGQHIDMLDIVYKHCGFKVSLDIMSKLNLGKGKHTQGRSILELDLEKLKIACKSDVRQTYKLWQLYSKKKLKYPEKYIPKYDLYFDEPGPAHPILERFPMIDEKYGPDIIGNMSDANQSEYLALLEGGGDPSWAMDNLEITGNFTISEIKEGKTKSKKKSKKVIYCT